MNISSLPSPGAQSPFSQVTALDFPSLVQCFSFLTNSSAPAESIRYASDYLSHCQSLPNFASALLEIADQHTDQIQLQSILLFGNVIKRHWGKRAKSNLVEFEKQKESLKDRLLKIYLRHAETHGKHITEIIKYISRFEYPVNYHSLHSMLLELLTFVYSSVNYTAAEALRKPIIILSTAKGVVKEFSLRKIQHQMQLFQKVWQIAQLAWKGREKLQAQIKERMRAEGTVENFKILSLEIQLLKKTDKIICYVIESLPSSQQTHPSFPPIIRSLLSTLAMMISALPLSTHPLYESMESYISYSLERLSKLQTTYPLMFGQILKDYLTGIVGMLQMAVQGKFKGDRMLTTLIQAATRPFNCFAYYMSPQQFGESIYFKKSSSSPQLLAPLQNHCHQQFLSIFSPPFPFLAFLMSTLMPSPSFFSIAPQDQFLLEQIGEQNAVDGITEQTPYQLALILCKSVMRCFKNQVKVGLPQICKLVITGIQSGQSEAVLANYIELVVIFPKVYEEEELPLSMIIEIITKLYSKKMELHLARMIKAYQQFFNEQQSVDAFTMICSLISHSQSLPPSIIYQCCLTLKKLLSSTVQSSLILPPSILSSLTGLLTNPEFISTPMMLWPTINLINQIIKARQSSSKEAIDEVVRGIQTLIQKSELDDVVTAGLADLLTNLIIIGSSYFRREYMVDQWPSNIDSLAYSSLDASSSYTLFPILASIQFLLINLPKQTQTPESLPRLLLSLLIHYPTLQQQHLLNLPLGQINTQLSSIIEQYGSSLLKQIPQIAIFIIQQAILIGIINVSMAMVEQVFKTVFSVNSQNQQSKQIRLLIPLSSLYLTGCIATSSFSTSIFELLMTKLMSLYMHVTPLINCLRSLLLIILDYHLLKLPLTDIFRILDSLNPDGRLYWISKCFWSYVFSINKMTNKINAAAVMHCVSQIGAQQYAKMIVINYEGSLPIDNLLKTLHLQLEPMKSGPLLTSYNHIYSVVSESSAPQPFSRKIKLHLSQFYQILASDIRPIYVQTMNAILKVLDWDQTDLKERVDAKCLEQIEKLLQGHQ